MFFNRGLTETGKRLVSDPDEVTYFEEVTRVQTSDQGEIQELRPVFRFVRESKVRVVKSGEIFKVRDDENQHEGGDIETYDLDKYIFADGTVLFERPQKQSAGFYFFTALQDVNGNWVEESLWTDEMILRSLGHNDNFRDWIKEPVSV